MSAFTEPFLLLVQRQVRPSSIRHSGMGPAPLEGGDGAREGVCGVPELQAELAAAAPRLAP
jgi:hypothetical protein